MEFFEQIPTWFWVMFWGSFPFWFAALWWVVQQIHKLRLDKVDKTEFNKSIDTLHKINRAMNDNFRDDINRANDRIDRKADKS
jgi:hypothetical protein